MEELTNNQYNYSSQKNRTLNELLLLSLIFVVRLIYLDNYFPNIVPICLLFSSILFMVASIQFHTYLIRNNKHLI